MSCYSVCSALRQETAADLWSMNIRLSLCGEKGQTQLPSKLKEIDNLLDKQRNHSWTNIIERESDEEQTNRNGLFYLLSIYFPTSYSLSIRNKTVHLVSPFTVCCRGALITSVLLMTTPHTVVRAYVDPLTRKRIVHSSGFFPMKHVSVTEWLTCPRRSRYFSMQY